MKRPADRLRIVAVLSIFVTIGVSADQGARSDRLSLWHGFVEIGFTEAELGDCIAVPGLPPRLVERSTFERLAGICDDQGDRPCDGRFTRVLERCLADDLEYRVDDEAPNSYFDPVHPTRVFYVKGRIRICYDATASGNCSDVDEVARGVAVWRFNDHFFQNPPLDNNFVNWDFSSTSVEMQTITDAKRFNLDGKGVRVSKGVSYGQATVRQNDQCFFSIDEEGNFILNANRCPVAGHSLLEVGGR